METEKLVDKDSNFSRRKNKRRANLSIKNINVCLFIIVFMMVNVLSFSSVKAASTYQQRVTNGIDSFPESYQKLLREFVENTFHYNWNFQAYYTGIDWNEFIAGEQHKNRVYYGYDVAHRCSCNDLQSGYYCANSEITSYFMDPRNFINERNIFQFLEISYNESLYNREMVHNLVKKYPLFNYGNPITFVMSDENHPNYQQSVTMTYTDIIMKAAEVSKMSPISMIVKIVQEVGSSGSGSTSGTNPTYPNTYNFFNIGASDTGDAILNGLQYADSKGWHCPYTSIVEGAMFNSDEYINAGQNTAYFYKFDCVGNKILKAGETQTISSSNLYHQYMTNIQDPYTQSATLFSTYTDEGLLDENLNFIIPVFDNMPEMSVDKISSLSNSGKDLYYADISSSLYIRDNPGGGNIISTIYKDDLVVMLQRNYSSGWDRIQLWDGKVGYTATEYLEKFVPNSGGSPSTPEIPSGGDDNVIGKIEGNIPNINYGYADVSSTLNLRAGAGTSYNVLASIQPKEEFIIQEETNNWYKVLLLNGLSGYVSKEYVVTMNYINIDEENSTITIIPSITANVVAGKVNAGTYSVKKADTEITDNSLGTGYVIKLDDKEYTVIKVGDVSGDGNITPLDYVKIRNHIMEVTVLEDSYKIAADVNYDNQITPLDYVKVKNHIMNISSISL